MQSATLFLVALAGVAAHATKLHGDNPLSKVIQLLDDLEAKVVKDGEAEQKSYTAYFEWCDETAANTQNEITSATNLQRKLKARIAQLGDDIEASTSKIDELADDIRVNSADLKAATGIRGAELKNFEVDEGQLVNTVGTLSRAISVLTREMQKNPAAFAQINAKSFAGLIQSLSAVTDAASFSVADKETLTSLVQAKQQASEDEDGPDAPAATVYKSHSDDIIDTLEELKEKAEAQLAALRKVETQEKHNFEMLKQSLQDQIAADTKNMNDQKAARAAAEEAKAEATEELEQTNKELADAKAALAQTQRNCIRVAGAHEQSITSRKEEITAIDQARSILVETSSGAEKQSYSMLQVAAKMETRLDLAGSEVVAIVRKLAQKQKSPALAQLASRIAAVLHFGAAGGVDPFAKIKKPIVDLISKLEAEAEKEATQKAYCDEYMAKTEAKKGELDDDIERLTSKIDTATARSTELKEQIQVVGFELGELAREQAEMDKIRAAEKAAYKVAKADLELGLSGVRKALSVLREYYGGASASMLQQPAEPVSHASNKGAGGSIIDVLEVVESDFASGLSKVETEEADAVSIYDTTTQENKVTKTLKDQDVKYKTQERKQKDAAITEMKSDRNAANEELSVVMDFYGKLKAKCIAVPETYEERQARRQDEIAGLKEALNVLENETAFVQRSKQRGLFSHSALAGERA